MMGAGNREQAFDELIQKYFPEMDEFRGNLYFLQSGDPGKRLQAVKYILASSHRNRRYALAFMLGEKERAIRKEAIRGLTGEVDGVVFNDLIAALDSETDHELAVEIVRVLGKIDDPTMAPAIMMVLEKVLRDNKNIDVQIDIIHFFSKSNDFRVFNPILAVLELKNKGSRYAANAMEEILRKIDKGEMKMPNLYLREEVLVRARNLIALEKEKELEDDKKWKQKYNEEINYYENNP